MLTKRSGKDRSFTCKQHHACLSLRVLRKRSPDGATTTGNKHPIAAYFSLIDPETMKG